MPTSKEAKKVAYREQIGDAMCDFEDELSDRTVSGAHLDAYASASSTGPTSGGYVYSV